MDLGLQDRVAVVTGGTSGIGLATARVLLSEGAAVAICGRDETRLAAARSSLLEDAAEKRLLAMCCDVLEEDAVGRFAAAVERWAGRCDILVTNAGQARMSTFADTSDAAWREELELKFFSQLYPVRAFKPLLDRSDAAAILAVNSLLAYEPEPYMVATSAARAGAQSLVKSLAREVAPRIRVNSVMLGLVELGAVGAPLHGAQGPGADAGGMVRRYRPHAAYPAGAPRQARRGRTRDCLPLLPGCRLHHRRAARDFRRHLPPHLVEALFSRVAPIARTSFRVCATDLGFTRDRLLLAPKSG